MPDFLGRLKTPRLAAAPGSPTVGEVYYDTVANQLYFRSNVAWVAAGGSSGALPADTVIATGTRIIANKFLAGDTQPAFRMFGSGKLEWGPGGTTAPDTNLYRSGTAVLKTDSAFGAVGQVQAGMGTAGQITLYPDPSFATIYFGSAADTNLYRYAANILKTDDGLQVGGQLDALTVVTLGSYIYSGSLAAGNGVILSRASGDVDQRFTLSNDGHMYWGPGVSTGSDVQLYRSSAGVLATDGTFSTPALVAGTVNASSYVRANNGGSIEVILGYNGSSNGAAIIFGTAPTWDTKLYRSAANQLTTDGQIIAKRGDGGAGFIFNPATAVGLAVYTQVGSEAQPRFYADINGVMRWGPGGSTAPDTSLYRLSASNLQTDGTFWAGNSLVVDANNGALGANKLYFGSALDTSLYRAAAGVLKTNGQLEVGATGVKFSDGSVQTKSAQRITGSVSSAGAALAGSGFSVSRTGAGQYDITFTTAFAAAPAVHVTNFSHTNRMPVIEPGTLTTTGCRVIWFDTGGAQQDVPFLFTATAIS